MSEQPKFTPEEIAAEEERRRRDNPTTPHSSSDASSGCGSLFLVIGIIVACIWLFNSCSNGDDEGGSVETPSTGISKSNTGKTDDSTIKGWGKTQAKNACHDQVKKQLKSPSTADFEGFTETVYMQNADKTKWTIRGHVDSQNSFGATVRSEWTCTVVPSDSDNASVQAVLVQ